MHDTNRELKLQLFMGDALFSNLTILEAYLEILNFTSSIAR